MNLRSHKSTNSPVRLGIAEIFHLQLKDSAQELSRALASHFRSCSGAPSLNTNSPPKLTTILTQQAILFTKIPSQPLVVASISRLANIRPVQPVFILPRLTLYQTASSTSITLCDLGPPPNRTSSFRVRNELLATIPES